MSLLLTRITNRAAIKACLNVTITTIYIFHNEFVNDTFFQLNFYVLEVTLYAFQTFFLMQVLFFLLSGHVLQLCKVLTQPTQQLLLFL